MSVKDPIPNTSVPVHARLAPEPYGPGVPFRVLPYGRSDRSVRIAWVDSGRTACGAVSALWVYETTLQIVVNAYESPTLSSAEGPGCPDRGVIHLQTVHLQHPVDDRLVSADERIRDIRAL